MLTQQTQAISYEFIRLVTFWVGAIYSQRHICDWSDKTSLIARKYTHPYNGIYLLFHVCYSNSARFVELLRIYCIHDEDCAKLSFSEKELSNLEDYKLIQIFYGDKTAWF